MNYKVIRSSTLKDPLISIIIPMFNVEEFIHETIQSILNQTFRGYELILVDDGSTDNTIDVVNNILVNVNNATIVIKENSGPGLSRNIGIELSLGEYISFVDSDDLLPVDALENMYSAALKQNADLITGMSKSFNKHKEWFIDSHIRKGAYEEGIKDLFNNPEMLYTLGPCNKMFKRELLQGVKYPNNIKVTEDHPFVIHAYLKANTIYTLDKVIYFYRQREDDNNISLSQLVNKESSPVVNDIFNSLKISDKLWELYIANIYERETIKLNYYNRIIKADLWPALNKCIKGGNHSDQEKVFHLILKWIKVVDRDFLNKLPLFSHMLTFQVINRYFFLSNTVRKTHKLILIELFNKINPDNLEILLFGNKGSEVKSAQKAARINSTAPIFLYLLKRGIPKRIKSLKNKMGVKVAKHGVFTFSKFMPVKKNKILFATNKSNKLSGSFKIIFDELMKKEHSYRTVGYFKHTRSFKELCKLYYDLATAKYVLLDDYYFQLYGLKMRRNAEVVQLWHAAGAFKKFGISSIGSIDSNTIEFERNAHQNYTKVIVSGEKVSKHYADAFGVPVKNVYPLGVPRTDLFLDNEYKSYVYKSYLKAYPILEGKRVITYAPTFRGRPGERATFNLELDLNRLYNEFGDDYIVILKLHPSVTKGVYIPNEYKDFVLNLSKNDVNNVLIVSDILITDYSSIIFDYALLNRPIIFYAYDLNEYLEERGFYDKYEEFVPGPIAFNNDDIIKLIRNGHLDLKVVKDFSNKYFDNPDGQSGKRIVEKLFF